MRRKRAQERLQKMREKVRQKLRLDRVPRCARKGVVGIVGGVCAIAGIVMIFTPGPAFVFIPLGLLILASEFPWAERWAMRVQEWMHQVHLRYRAWRKRRRAEKRALQAKRA